jgi:hypothetical protein
MDSLLEADDEAEGENPAESVNRAKKNKIVEDVHLADPAMQSNEMCARSRDKDHHDYQSVIAMAIGRG